MVTGFPVHPQCDREGPTQRVNWAELEISGVVVEDRDHRCISHECISPESRSKTESPREDYICTFFVCSMYLSYEGFSMNIYGYVKLTSLPGCFL